MEAERRHRLHQYGKGECEMKLFKKIQEQRNNEMETVIKQILPANYTIESFEFDRKHFGNIIVKINSPNKHYTFVTDRGEIYCNGKMICDSSYRYFEKEDTFAKLLSVIESEVK